MRKGERTIEIMSDFSSEARLEVMEWHPGARVKKAKYAYYNNNNNNKNT